MTLRLILGIVVASTSVVALAASVSQAQQQVIPEFPHTTERGRAAGVFQNDDLRVVATYYYSQRHHDSRWLLIKVGVMANHPTQIDREDIYLLTPSGQRVELPTQRAWRKDHQQIRLLRNEARTMGHPLRDYFTKSDVRDFRFFALKPVGPGTGRDFFISYDFFDANRYRLEMGDLYFASPTDTWDKGTYALVFEVEEKDIRAVLPIHLE